MENKKCSKPKPPISLYREREREKVIGAISPRKIGKQLVDSNHKVVLQAMMCIKIHVKHSIKIARKMACQQRYHELSILGGPWTGSRFWSHSKQTNQPTKTTSGWNPQKKTSKGSIHAERQVSGQSQIPSPSFSPGRLQL